MKIAFLLDNAYGIGGTIRSTVNLSRALAERHRVEVVSLRRHAETPALPFDRRVTMTSLLDLRRDSPHYDGDNPRFHQPSERFAEGADHFERRISTLLGDERVREYLESTEADVVIGTRPKINDYLAAYGSGRYLRIGQEHLTHQMHSEHKRTHQDAAIVHLDAFVTVSYADAADYHGTLRDSDVQIVCIPNAVAAPDVEPSSGENKLIVAAGRLVGVKRYDRLISAFALICEKHPDWRLRIYGRGRQQAALRKTINQLGLYDRAFLMGPHSPIETEWAKGSIAAVSSDAESFGIGLVEAMHCGVPVVSTDCPHGPGEIITNGEDGLLAPLGKPDFSARAFADALLQLIENPETRQRMGRAALKKAARYAPERIAREYEQLIARLHADRHTRRMAQSAPSAPSARGSASSASPGTAALAVTPPAAVPAVTPPSPSRPVVGAPLSPAAPKGRKAVHARYPAPVPRSLPRRALRRLLVVLTRPLLRRLRRTLRRPLALKVRRLIGRPAPVSQPQVAGATPHTRRALAQPHARVRVGADGSLLLRLRAAKLPKGEATLLLRARHRPDTPPVRVPLPRRSTATDGWLQLRLDHAQHQLSEARWDTYLERGVDRRRKRVRAELVETAPLLSQPPPRDSDGRLTPWIPYATGDGFLAIRAWQRANHAEVTTIRADASGFLLRARLYGHHDPAGVALLAVPRDKDAPGFDVAGTPTEEADGAVRFELPYDLPAALNVGAEGETAYPVWDLRVRPTEGAPPVPLSRLLGDLADRKKTDVIPVTRLGDTETGLKLYFTLNNNLALALQPLTEETPGRTAQATVSRREQPEQPEQPERPEQREQPATGSTASPGQSSASSPSASAS